MVSADGMAHRILCAFHAVLQCRTRNHAGDAGDAVRSGWNRLLICIIKDMAFIGAGSAIIAIMITENARYAMILAEWMLREVIEPRRKRQIERWRQEGIEKGRQEGIDHGDMEWETWISRKMLAESRGEHFDEPMPSQTRRNSQP